jgi:hypothetical protein
MKKYPFGMFVIVLAITFSAFKKTTPMTLDYTFTLQSSPTSSGVIIANEEGFFSNWLKTGTAITACNPTDEEKACSILVNAKYTTTIGSDILLNVTDPDGAGSKEAFPMAVALGTYTNNTQYYIVSLFIEYYDPSGINVRNGTVN